MKAEAIENSNRVIKFRAWDKEAKEMIHPHPYSFISFDGSLGEAYPHEIDAQPMMKSVDYLIPMQFTGLHDKNGKEIWEGDIVKGDWSIVDDIEVGVVEFYGGAFRFKPAGLPLEYGYYRRECEVIGNIYEQGHLLDNK